MKNREIKFRAWDGKKMRFLNLYQCINYNTDFVLRENNEEAWIDDHCGDVDWPVMEYTGLKDKQGVEIYEGDIVNILNIASNEMSFTVEYGIHRRKMSTGWDVDIAGFAFMAHNENQKYPTFPIVNNYKQIHDLSILSIIGNIYQHPHLIPA